MDHLLFVLVGLVAAGVGAQWVASRLRFPALLLLLATGLFLGPGLRALGAGFALNPSELLGDLKGPFVSLAVAVVLFEGGLTLEFREARQVGTTLTRLLLSGLVVGFALTTLLGVYVGGLSIATAAVVGAILVVTGPTVILPMLRSARISIRPATLLKWEGIVNDPFGAILALFVVEAAVLLGSEGHGVLGLAWTFLWTGTASALLGVVAGRLLERGLDNGWIHENLKSPVILASVLVVFAAGEALQHEMGLLSVTVMGIVLANSESPSLIDIRRFKEQIATLLVSLLFLVLSADLETESLDALFGRPLILILGVLFVIRPIVGLLATAGSALPFGERALVAWIAPRGVVAAAVAAAFAPDLVAAGYEDGKLLVPIIFGVIVATVVLHGLSIRPLARYLGLAAKEGNGILIVGASSWVVSLAQALARAGAFVVLADTRYRKVSLARQEGVEVHYGDVLSEEAAMELPMERVSWVLGATDDDHYNALTCLRFAHELGREATFQVTGVKAAGAPAMSGQTPWAESGTYRGLTSRFWKGASFKVTSLSEEFGYEAWREQNPEALALFYVHNERLRVIDEKAEAPTGAQLVHLS